MLLWDQKLVLGIDIIDEQHKSIFEEINKLANAYYTGNEKQETYEALCFIEEYVNKHFNTEEFYLKKYNYPDFEQHILLHRDFSRNLDGYKIRHRKTGIDGPAVKEMLKFLVNWWFNHIQKVDVQYVGSLSSKINKIDVAK